MTSLTPTTSSFGSLLRQWRNSRNLSQLMLSVDAMTTTRHISFLETGRSRPTKSMVERLSEALNVPLRDRNQLLIAAGLPPSFPEEPFDAERYAPAREAIERLLRVHEPYPAMVVDKAGNVLAANDGVTRLFGEDLTDTNILGWYATQNPAKLFANWDVMAHAFVTALRRDIARNPLDEGLKAALKVSEAAAKTITPTTTEPGLAACPWFRVGDKVIKTMILAASFDNVIDVTLDELRVELVYPLDDEAEAFFRGN